MTQLPTRNRVLAAAVATALVVAACGDDNEETAADETADSTVDDGAAEPATDDEGTDEDEAADEGQSSKAETIEVADGVTVTGAWARTSPAMAEAGAAYFEISSEDEELRIVSASVAEDVAGTVELHETVAADGDHGGSTGTTGDDTAEHDTAEDRDASSNDDGDDAMGDDPEGGDHEGMDMAMTMREVEAIVVPAGGSTVLEPGGMHVMLLDLAQPLEAGDTFDLTLVTETGDELIVPIEVMDQAP